MAKLQVLALLVRCPDPVRQLLAGSFPSDQCLYPMIMHRAQVALPFMIVGMSATRKKKPAS